MKIKITGNIQARIYIIPLTLILHTLMSGVIGSAEGILVPMLVVLAFSYVVGIILLIFFRQCKKIYYDMDNLYINSIFKNKLINTVNLNQVDAVKNYVLFVKIVYQIDNKIFKVYTVQDRKAVSEAYGMHEMPGFELLWGKPNFRIEQLKKIIINKKSEYASK